MHGLGFEFLEAPLRVAGQLVQPILEAPHAPEMFLGAGVGALVLAAIVSGRGESSPFSGAAATPTDGALVPRDALGSDSKPGTAAAASSARTPTAR